MGADGLGWFSCDVPDHTHADGSVCGRGLNRGDGEAWRGGARDSGVSGLRDVWTGSGLHGWCVTAVTATDGEESGVM